jgi:DNA replication protein DnaC
MGDPVLVTMLTQAARMAWEITHGETPRWLCLCGASGTGKTHLARRLIRKARSSGRFSTAKEGEEIAYPYSFVIWPECASELQRGRDSDDYYHAKRTQFLVLDDIGAIKDATGHITSKLGELLGARENRWTVITTNFLPQEIAERMDTRIASRLIRGRNIVVQCKTVDYALRAGK